MFPVEWSSELGLYFFDSSHYSYVMSLKRVVSHQIHD
jgi:hypothetical protein